MTQEKSILDGFELVRNTAPKAEYFFTVQKNSLNFSVSCIDYLGEAEYVYVYRNVSAKQLAITPAKEMDDDAMKFYRNWGRPGSAQRVAKITSQKIRRWIIEVSGKGEDDRFSVEGRPVFEEKAIIFDLNKTGSPNRNRVKSNS